MVNKLADSRRQLLAILALMSLISIGFSVVRIITTGTTTYWFLIWNLFLAWLPMLLAWWLVGRLRQQRWQQPTNLLITALWLGFLPNAFYITSDIIHLQDMSRTGSLYDLVMLVSFAFSGLVLGYLSLFAVHAHLRRRFSSRATWFMTQAILLLCSFAIYLGHYLRWNSWDVLINPAGILFDVSEPFVNPAAHPQVFTTTLMFFVLLSGFYIVIYKLFRLAQAGSADL